MTDYPIRYSAIHLGRHYPASDWILWDARFSPAPPHSQYGANAKAQALHFKYLPAAIRACRDVPSAADNPSLLSYAKSLVETAVGKFFILYSIRPLRAGGPYPFRPNYLWDLPQNLFDKLASALLEEPQANALHAAVTQDVLDLCALEVKNDTLVRSKLRSLTHKRISDPNVEKLGGLVGRKLDDRQPLNDAQRLLVLRAGDVHHEQAVMVLKWCDTGNPMDLEAAQILGAEVQRAHMELVASARDLDEATLLEMIFTGDIDPKHDPAVVAQFTESLHAWHHQWTEALLVPGVPDTTKVWDAVMGHNGEHFKRACAVGKLRAVCIGDIHYCPVVGTPFPPEVREN